MNGNYDKLSPGEKEFVRGWLKPTPRSLQNDSDEKKDSALRRVGHAAHLEPQLWGLMKKYIPTFPLAEPNVKVKWEVVTKVKWPIGIHVLVNGRGFAITNGKDGRENIRIFDMEGKEMFEMNSSKFGYIVGVCEVKQRGLIVCVDQSKHCLHVLNISNGSYVRQVGSQGSDAGQFSKPGGVCGTSKDLVIVADTDNNRIQILDPSNDWTTVRIIRVNYPTAVCVDQKDNIYTTETNGRIKVFSIEGKELRSLFGYPTQFSKPSGIAVSVDGKYIVVSDYNNHSIQVIQSNGTPIAAFGSRRPGPGRLLFPRNISLLSDGSLLIADSGNNRIVKLSAL